jgi:hypothetical protein
MRGAIQGQISSRIAGSRLKGYREALCCSPHPISLICARNCQFTNQNLCSRTCTISLRVFINSAASLRDEAKDQITKRVRQIMEPPPLSLKVETFPPLSGTEGAGLSFLPRLPPINRPQPIGLPQPIKPFCPSNSKQIILTSQFRTPPTQGKHFIKKPARSSQDSRPPPKSRDPIRAEGPGTYY